MPSSLNVSNPDVTIHEVRARVQFVFAKMLKKCRRVKQHVQRDKRLLMAKRNKRGGDLTDVRVEEISNFKFVQYLNRI